MKGTAYYDYATTMLVALDATLSIDGQPRRRRRTAAPGLDRLRFGSIRSAGPPEAAPRPYPQTTLVGSPAGEPFAVFAPLGPPIRRGMTGTIRKSRKPALVWVRLHCPDECVSQHRSSGDHYLVTAPVTVSHPVPGPETFESIVDD